jgi:hypothetical protein
LCLICSGGIKENLANLGSQTFAAAVAEFHRCLEPGGLLSVRHSNLRVSDTPLCAAFETILRMPLQGAARTPVFGPDNVLVADADCPDTVFANSDGDQECPILPV